ncbi:unnamed protein product [Cuscuta europaea]|uniref:DUF4283 domain-containing protein n=1 Tax=Cuscuta europaea TaxID=41803 RepID=A0A9P0ZD63_CUSEU|nr:unnamed protein product [Cuscuta europaea]
MARKKQGLGEVSEARVTRSRFTLLENEFPGLSPERTPEEDVQGIDGYVAMKPALVVKPGKEPSAGKSTAPATEDKSTGKPPGTSVITTGKPTATKAIAVDELPQTAGKKSVALFPGKLAAIEATSGNPTVVLLPGKPAAIGAFAGKPTAAKDAGKTVAKDAGSVSNVTATAPEAVTFVAAGSPKMPEKKQWNTLFKDNRAPSEGLKLRYIPPTSDMLDFSDRVLPSMVDIFGYCLVGFFTGRFPGLKATYSLTQKWGVHCQVKPHDKGWVVFKFKNEADRTKVMLEGPYILYGKLLVLKVLSDDFSFEDDEFLKVPIWIKFPKLPVRLWNEDTISEVASKVGIPLTTDRITLERANHNFARVLIEVDVSKPPPFSFPIKMASGRIFEQRVLYETFPNYGFHCKLYGHHPFICKHLADKEKTETACAKSVLDPMSAAAVEVNTDTLQPAQVIVNAEPCTAALVTVEPCTATLVAAEVFSAAAIIEGQPSHQPAAATYPTGHCPSPTGSSGQVVSQGSASAVFVGATYLHTDQGVARSEPTAQGSPNDDECSDTEWEDTERFVVDAKYLRIDDVVVRVVITKGKTFKFIVKPFTFVHSSVVRVDSSLRLTDDLDAKGLTFLTKCLEAMPGVTKKKGDICFDSRFTSPFRAFLGV